MTNDSPQIIDTQKPENNNQQDIDLQNYDPQNTWKGFHWTFFINVQGLILSLLCFNKAFEDKNYSRADQELRCAADLLLASGAAMKLAGSFKPEEYQNSVRQSMMPPHVSIDNFSGLMGWEHARLIRLWRQLGPTFGNLPASLNSAHQYFVESFVDMIGSHRDVCDHFVGDEDSSLRSSDSAVNVLEKVLSSRLRIIDPKNTRSSACPFAAQHSNKATNEGKQE